MTSPIADGEVTGATAPGRLRTATDELRVQAATLECPGMSGFGSDRIRQFKQVRLILVDWLD